MITDDVEFYHDRGGFNLRKPNDFVGQFRERCTNLLDPKAVRIGRVLLTSSLHVDPIPGWGAMEMSDHLFHQRTATAAPKSWSKSRNSRWSGCSAPTANGASAAG